MDGEPANTSAKIARHKDVGRNAAYFCEEAPPTTSIRRSLRFHVGAKPTCRVGLFVPKSYRVLFLSEGTVDMISGGVRFLILLDRIVPDVPALMTLQSI